MSRRATTSSSGQYLPVAVRRAAPYLGLSAGMALAGGRRGRRAALRGLLSVGAAGAVRNTAAKAQRRFGIDTGSSGDQPDGSLWMPAPEATLAAGFITAAALESAPWTMAAAAVGLAIAGRPTEPRDPSSVVIGVAVGTATAMATLRWWPRIDTSPAEAPRVPSADVSTAGADGAGLTVVANLGAGRGSDEGEDQLDEIRNGLPAAEVQVIGEDDDLIEVLEEAAASADALGMLGGDGSINAAAKVAMEAQIPLVVFPGGTLNHFARDLGIDTIADAIAAVADGVVIEVDTASIADRPFLNTASLGSYSELVMARERLEDRIGKWPALLVAMVQVLRTSSPTSIVIDGEARQVWMIFLGNGSYDPPGFAPATRPRLDDELIDVRLVDGTAPAARLRLMLALLTGTLGRSRVYHRSLARRLEIRADDRHPVLAADGEVFEGPNSFAVVKHPRALRVHAPAR